MQENEKFLPPKEWKEGSNPFKVAELKIQRMRGNIYRLLRDGKVYRLPTPKARRQYWQCPTCKKKQRLRKPDTWEEVSMEHLNLPPDVYPIKRKIGWWYYIDKDGDISAFLWRGPESKKALVFASYKDYPNYDPNLDFLLRYKKQVAKLRELENEWEKLTGLKLHEHFPGRVQLPWV